MATQADLDAAVADARAALGNAQRRKQLRKLPEMQFLQHLN